MRAAKKKRLAARGLAVGDARGFLGLSEEEAAFVELKLALADNLRQRRRERGMTDRIIFPIHDETGRVVWFGGSVMDHSTPKYLNSPETLVYSKRRVLYGLNCAKSSCRTVGSVFTVEGYLDLISLHQHGVTNSVATLGTSLSLEHLRLLKRHAGQMVLVYDSDEAGIRSAQRCVDIFWREHVDFRREDVFREERADTHILVLPDGHDPDSFLRTHGVAEFRALAQNAPGIITFVMERAVLRYGLTTEGKIRIVADMHPFLADIEALTFHLSTINFQLICSGLRNPRVSLNKRLGKIASQDYRDHLLTN